MNDTNETLPANKDDALVELAWLIQDQHRIGHGTMNDLIARMREYFTGLDNIKCVVPYSEWPWRNVKVLGERKKLELYMLGRLQCGDRQVIFYASNEFSMHDIQNMTADLEFVRHAQPFQSPTWAKHQLTELVNANFEAWKSVHLIDTEIDGHVGVRVSRLTFSVLHKHGHIHQSEQF